MNKLLWKNRSVSHSNQKNWAEAHGSKGFPLDNTELRVRYICNNTVNEIWQLTLYLDDPFCNRNETLAQHFVS